MVRWFFWLLLLPLRLPFLLLRRFSERVRPITVLQLKLKGAIPDVSVPSGMLGQRKQAPLLQILSALRAAVRDPKLRQVVITLDDPHLGLGRAEELRVALRRVADAGKQVIAVSEHLGLAGYWVALGATRIVLSPTGTLDVVGVASRFTLLKGLLDKAGIRARLLARGEYKSMREMFAADEISDANREMLASVVESYFSLLKQRIASARGIEPERVASIVDRGPFRAEQAKELGLVDELGYAWDVEQERKRDRQLRAVGERLYLKRRLRRFFPVSPPRVALLEVDGSIRSGKNAYGPTGKRATGSESFVKALARIAADRSIRAIVLRVNSPGGSALASDVMWHGLKAAKTDRPLYVSMGEVAASGGYYVSGVEGARIYANPTTLTGSIGVVGGKMEVSGVMRRLGIKQEFIAIGENADFHSPTRDWSEQQWKKMSDEIDALYEDFVQKMAHGRGMSFAELEQVARGRVWTGAQALERRLVDAEGSLVDVLAAVRAALGLAEDTPLALVTESGPGLLKRLVSRLSGGEAHGFGLAAETALLQRWLPGLGASTQQLEDALAMPRERLWARLPFDIELF